MRGRVDQPGAVQHIHVAETHTAQEGKNWPFVPQVVRHEGGNDAPDEDDQGDVEATLEAHDRIVPQVRQVNLLS